MEVQIACYLSGTPFSGLIIEELLRLFNGMIPQWIFLPLVHSVATVGCLYVGKMKVPEFLKRLDDLKTECIFLQKQNFLSLILTVGALHAQSLFWVH